MATYLGVFFYHHQVILQKF